MRHLKFVRSCSRIMAILLTVSAVVAVPSTSATAADNCPSYNLATIFQEEFYPGVKWNNTQGPRQISWTTNVTTVNGNPISRPFTPAELGWLREAISSWDMALDTISFREESSKFADIEIGLTAIQNSGYWTVKQFDGFRSSGSIQISTSTKLTSQRGGFIEVAQSELGNLLGLGDITIKTDYDSVMKDPDIAPFGSVPLADMDIDMMRQFYGESTCRSSWSTELKQAKADAVVRAEAEAKAKAEAEAKAKAEAEAEAIAREKALQEALEQAKRDEIANLKLRARTIAICSNGKLVRKVVAQKPKCPRGFKRIA